MVTQSVLPAWSQALNGDRLSGVPIVQISPELPASNQVPGSGNGYYNRNYSATVSPAPTYNAARSVPGYAENDSSPTAYANTTVKVISPADTSRSAQQDALNLIPWQDLNAEGRRKIKEVVDRPSMFRRLPASQISCDPQFFTFSIRNPETIVNMWQVFGVTTMGLQRTGPYMFAGNDGAGTDCTAELVFGDNSRHIYVGTGSYEGPVFRRKITGKCVAILRTDTSNGANQFDLTNQLDIFIKIDNLAADLVAKTLHPLVGRTADHNFHESLLFLQAFSETAEKDPNRVAYLSQRLESVEPTTRNQFQQVVNSIGPRQNQYLMQQDAIRQTQAITPVRK